MEGGQQDSQDHEDVFEPMVRAGDRRIRQVGTRIHDLACDTRSSGMA